MQVVPPTKAGAEGYKDLIIESFTLILYFLTVVVSTMLKLNKAVTHWSDASMNTEII